jgi:hypothetical protein
VRGHTWRGERGRGEGADAEALPHSARESWAAARRRRAEEEERSPRMAAERWAARALECCDVGCASPGLLYGEACVGRSNPYWWASAARARPWTGRSGPCPQFVFPDCLVFCVMMMMIMMRCSFLILLKTKKERDVHTGQTTIANN